MNTPFSLRRALPALLLAGGLLCTPPIRAEDINLSELLAKQAALLDELSKAVAAASQGANDDARPIAQTVGLQGEGLQTSGLKTSSLQTSSLRSMAAGFTPVDQWRAFFSQKKQ